MQQTDLVSAKIAEYLLEINAIKLQPSEPFTWASGWKSPIYSDNRLSLSHPVVRTFIKRELGKLINSRYPDVEGIIGVATAGIAPGALVADDLELPFGYVRSEAKKHGMAKQLEGDFHPGQRVVVVEDLVSTGKSSLAAIEALREYGCRVLGMVSIFTYGFEKAIEAFKAADCTFYSLGNYHTLIEVATRKGIISKEEAALLEQWRKSPETWGQ